MKRLLAIVLCLVFVLAGCSGIVSRKEYNALKLQNDELILKNEELASQIEKLNTENEQLKDQKTEEPELIMSKVFDLNNQKDKALIKTISVKQDGLKVENIIVIQLEKNVFDISFRISYKNEANEVIGTTDVIYEMQVADVGKKTQQFSWDCDISKPDLINSIEIEWINAGG